MLISELISEIITEVGGDTTDTALTAAMLVFAKGALRRFPLFSRNRLLVDTSYSTLSSGANYLTTPTGFIREISIYYEETGGARKYIEKLTEGQFGSRVNTGTSGTISYYRIVGNVIEFDRNTDTERVIYVEHFKEVDDIETTDNFFGTSDMLEILKDGMKATYYSDYVEDDAKGDRKMGLFKAGLDELESKFMMSEHGGHIDEA